MKKLLSVFVLVFVLSTAFNAAAATKIDPLLNLLPKAKAEGVSFNVAKSADVNGETFVTVLIKATNLDVVSEKVDELGGTVRSTLQTILIASIPLDAVGKLADVPEVVYIEADRRVTRKMNFARSVTLVDDVQSAIGIDTGYNGAGVIVGTVDSGIDCTHADFKDANGVSRILYYWDQGGDIDYTYNATNCSNARDTEAHGTHVAGIAAGSNATYKGVAPQASIIAVKASASDADSGGTFASSVIEGVQYIFKKAQELKVPAVVNLSIGTSQGAHDNTSLFEQGLNELLLAKQGRAIVNAAGNENLSFRDPGFATLGGIHAPINVTGAPNLGYEFLPRNGNDAILVDVWLDAGGTCTVDVAALSAATPGAPLLRVGAVSAGGDGQTSNAALLLEIDFTDSVNVNNGKQHAQLLVSSKGVASLEDYTFDLILKGACTGNAWLYPDYTSLNDFTRRNGMVSVAGDYTYAAGDSNMTTTIPGTAASVITVGSFMGRATWVDINGVTHDQTAASGPDYTLYGATGGVNEDISVFSSLGPTAAASNNIKPDITAPGEPIISTLSSQSGSPADALLGDATHWKLEGTSMASPHTTGTVALLLNRNGCLTPEQIKAAIKNNAINDAFTGVRISDPNNIWGTGKLNALAAANSISALTCAPDNPVENSYTAGPTQHDTGGGGGGGGCMLLPISASSATGMLILLVPVVAAIVRRRTR